MHQLTTPKPVSHRLRVTRLAGVLAAVAIAAQAAMPGVVTAGGMSPNHLQLTSLASPAGTDGPQLKPLQIVVLVDESGSLSDTDVAGEKDAANLIVRGELSPASTVSVLGFGSSNGPGQKAIDPVCGDGRPLSEAREETSQCVATVHRRTEAEGNNTDFISALNESAHYLLKPDTPRIIFILTDGKLQVPDSNNYPGSTAAQKQDAAQAQLPLILGRLRDQGIQVWPLGFGTQIDEPQLRQLAEGAAGPTCPQKTDQPRQTIIKDSQQLLETIGDVFSRASCDGPTKFVDKPLSSGADAELNVEIPQTATDGKIIVYKRNPNVKVTYFPPGSQTQTPTNGDMNGSTYSLDGDQTDTESLSVTNPNPGKWTIKLKSPANAPDVVVAATAVFQAAIQAVLIPDPRRPHPGALLDVTLRLYSRRGNISDHNLLDQLDFSAVLSGPGFAPLPVSLSDPAQDGVYAGSVAVPTNAAGDLTVTGSVAGPGVSGDTRTATVTVLPLGAESPLEGQVRLLDEGDDVTPGTALQGEVVLTNRTGRPQALNLGVRDSAPGTSLAVSPDVLTFDESPTSRVPFTLMFDKDTSLGPNGATLELVDGNTTVITQINVVRTVRTPTGKLWHEILGYWWLLLIAAFIAIAGIAGASFFRRSRSRAMSMRGVTIDLVDMHGVVSQLRARANTSETFPFVIQGTSLEHPSAENALAPRHMLAKKRNAYEYTNGEGERLPVRANNSVPLTEDLELRFRERGSKVRPEPPASSPGRANRPEDTAESLNSSFWD